MKKTFWLLVIFALFISSQRTEKQTDNGSKMVKQLIGERDLKMSWEDLSYVIVGIQYELTKGATVSFLECMLKDQKTIEYILGTIEFVQTSEESFIKKAWISLGNFFNQLQDVLKNCIKQRITPIIKTVVLRFLAPQIEVISKVATVLWNGVDIVKSIQGLIACIRESNYFELGINIGKLVKLAGKIFPLIYDGFSTKEHAFLDGFTQEFAPEISQQLELCVGLDDELVFRRLESNILKINNSSSNSEISETLKDITNIYLKVANNEFCNFGDIPEFLAVTNQRFTKWTQLSPVSLSSQDNNNVMIDDLLQAKASFESNHFVAAGKLFGKYANLEMNMGSIF